MRTSNSSTVSQIVLTLLSALILLLAAGAHARKPPAWNPYLTPPIAAPPRVATIKSAPATQNPSRLGMICQSASGGGVVAFDSAVAISRSGLRSIPFGGGRTVYHLTTPDTLRNLSIHNPGRCPWQLVGGNGVIREGVAEGAFVAFDTSGRVVSVAVYQINRVVEREPQMILVGDTLVLRGRFLVAADTQRGRKIIQRGTSAVLLNARTGRIIATQ